jgi:hypothetical protein
VITVRGVWADGTFTVTSVCRTPTQAAVAADMLFGINGIVKVITHMEVTVDEYIPYS